MRLTSKLNVKVKFTLEQATKAQIWSSTLSLTSALYGVGGRRQSLDALPQGKFRYPLYMRLGGSQGRSGRVREISPAQEFDPRTFQSVASRYTEWAIPAEDDQYFYLMPRVKFITALPSPLCIF